MTTNNPPIAAWAPSSALAKLASRHNNAPCVLTDGPAEFNDVALIRLSDYEALQAECEKLRKDAERYQWLRDGASMLTDLNPWEDVGFVCAVCVCTEYGSQTALTDEDLDAAIDAAMEGDKP